MARPRTSKDKSLCVKLYCPNTRHIGRLCEEHYTNYKKSKAEFGGWATAYTTKVSQWVNGKVTR